MISEFKRQNPLAVKTAPALVENVPATAETAISEGKKIYEENCAACHATGLAGAPKVGNRTVWVSRIAKGVPNLLRSALNGKNAMPPKGGASFLSQDQLKASVEYMVIQSR